jgi:hypothetical protein
VRPLGCWTHEEAAERPLCAASGRLSVLLLNGSFVLKSKFSCPVQIGKAGAEGQQTEKRSVIAKKMNAPSSCKVSLKLQLSGACLF